MPSDTPATTDLAPGYKAVALLCHAYLTGLILTTVTHRNKDDAAELVFRTFRRQHLDKFLPGLKKLGLHGLPHAVAAAQYHYLSNFLGGVKVEYMYESDRKAWVAICRRAGFSRAQPSALCPPRCRAPCCAAGTPTMG